MDSWSSVPALWLVVKNLFLGWHLVTSSDGLFRRVSQAVKIEFLKKAHVDVCMYVIFICKTHLSRACDCVHHSCASVHVSDCASVHVHVHGCDHDHGCVSVHDLSIKMQVQFNYNLHKFTCHKKTVSLIFQEGGGRVVPGDPHFCLLIVFE